MIIWTHILIFLFWSLPPGGYALCPFSVVKFINFLIYTTVEILYALQRGDTSIIMIMFLYIFCYALSTEPKQFIRNKATGWITDLWKDEECVEPIRKEKEERTLAPKPFEINKRVIWNIRTKYVRWNTQKSVV